MEHKTLCLRVQLKIPALEPPLIKGAQNVMVIVMVIVTIIHETTVAKRDSGFMSIQFWIHINDT